MSKTKLEQAPPTPQAQGFRMPAEWEPHAATWLVWPNSKDWPGKLQAVRWVCCEVTRLLVVGERVRMIVTDEAAQARAAALLRRSGAALSQVDFFLSPTDRGWARDNLPLFVTSRRRPGELGAVKFRFNGWARYPDHQLDDLAGIRVAQRAAQVWQPHLELGGKTRRFVLEGGSIDVDGEGTLLTTRRCLLGTEFARNPGATRPAVEKLLQRSLGVKRIIWLEDGIAGDDTSGHVDDFARFVSPGVVVCAQEQNPADDNHRLLGAALEQLSGATDAKGRRLEVVPLPMPSPVYFQGERLPASYANFYIANDAVLVPTFNDAADRHALGILSELFPDRRVVGVHSTDLVLGLGALHCSTMQEPRV